ncbi:FAD-linked oxidase C-terminal domain-containing protein [Sphingomonas panni]
MRDVQRLIAADPVAIEILDDKVLGVARSDIIWSSVEGLLGGASDAPVAAMNFVEFTADDDATIDAGLAALADIGPQGDMRIVRDDAAIGQLWTLREKSVGLLARLGGARQGIPFVEDTAVPPEKLADFVAEFRALLDGHGLNYGMFGHADVGCLHVRPFLDLRDPAQAVLIRPISDEVARLTKSYGGLLWGEHGRGYRGEFSPLFFGSLYPELQALKAAFDPHNRLNPGKLAAPAGQPIDRIDGVSLRGEADRRIDATRSKDFDRAVACNGNGACFAWDLARRDVPVLQGDTRPRAIAEGPRFTPACLGAAGFDRRTYPGRGRRTRCAGRRYSGVARHLSVVQGVYDFVPGEGRRADDEVALCRALLGQTRPPAAPPRRRADGSHARRRAQNARDRQWRRRQ